MNKINIQILENRHPELYQFFKESGDKPLQVLERLVKDNQRMKVSLEERQSLMAEFSQVLLRELVPMRLALRTTEKQIWMLSQLKNTEIMERNLYHPDQPFPRPQTLKERTSEPFALLSTLWEDYIREKQVEYASRTQRKMAQYEESLKQH